MAEKPRLKLPKEAKKGEVIEIKTLLPHIMESGQRKDKDGTAIPRKIINKFVCEFNGKPVFTASSSRRSPPTPICSSTRRWKKAARSSSPGPMMTAPSPRPKKQLRSPDTRSAQQGAGRTMIVI